VEEPLDAVAIVGGIARGIDAALRGDAVRAARGVVEGEATDAVAQLAQRGGGGSAGQTGAHHDDLEPAAARRADECQIVAVALPARGEWAGRCGVAQDHRSHPVTTATGTAAKPAATASDTPTTAGLRRRAAVAGRRPRLRAAAQSP
jgi:hypothetical protein